MDKTTLRTVVWEEMLFADMRANDFAELMRRPLRMKRGDGFSQQYPPPPKPSPPPPPKPPEKR